MSGDEAIALADRILVMSQGRITDQFALSDPEKTDEPAAVSRLRRALLETLGVCA